MSVVLVTGAASGLGWAMTRRWHEAGHELVLADVEDHHALGDAAPHDQRHRSADVGLQPDVLVEDGQAVRVVAGLPAFDVVLGRGGGRVARERLPQ